MKKLKINLIYSNACERAMNIWGYFFYMKTLSEALQEFKKTSPILNPRLCLNELTGCYIVTLMFSKIYCESKNLKVIL